MSRAFRCVKNGQLVRLGVVLGGVKVQTVVAFVWRAATAWLSGNCEYRLLTCPAAFLRRKRERGGMFLPALSRGPFVRAGLGGCACCVVGFWCLSCVVKWLACRRSCMYSRSHDA